MSKEWKFENRKDTPLGRVMPEAAEKFKRMDYTPEDFYQHFPCFMGAKQIGRFMSIYDCYRQTLGVAGHIAEVGVFRGAVSFFLTKLTLLNEPHALTQVHGFDWFRRLTEDELGDSDTSEYHEPYERIRDLIDVQGLQAWLFLHRIDVKTELKGFFEENSHLQFKLIMLDAGDYEIVASSIREFWPRLSTGGIMIFDQFNHEAAPGETKAIKKLLPEDAVIRTFPNGWMPTAYVVKGEKI